MGLVAATQIKRPRRGFPKPIFLEDDASAYAEQNVFLISRISLEREDPAALLETGAEGKPRDCCRKFLIWFARAVEAELSREPAIMRIAGEQATGLEPRVYGKPFRDL